MAYYKSVSAAERSYRDSMIDIQTTQRLREMQYVSATAIQNLENSLDSIQKRSYTSYCAPMMWYYGVFGMGTNVDVPLQFGSQWQISDYASNYTDAPGYSQGVANAYYDFYMNGYTSPITTEYSSSYFGGNLLGEGDRRTLTGTSTTLQGGLSGLSLLANLQSYAADRQQISAKFDALGIIRRHTPI